MDVPLRAQDAKQTEVRSVTFTARQLQKKFHHAHAFGVAGSYSAQRAEQFARAVRRHVEATTTIVIEITYRGKRSVLAYVDPESGVMAMTDRAGAFISGWKLTSEQLNRISERGTL